RLSPRRILSSSPFVLRVAGIDPACAILSVTLRLVLPVEVVNDRASECRPWRLVARFPLPEYEYRFRADQRVGHNGAIAVSPRGRPWRAHGRGRARGRERPALQGPLRGATAEKPRVHSGQRPFCSDP